MNALKITTTGHMSKVTIESPTFRGLAKAIDARNFEVVHATGLEPPLIMIVDEEGLLTGKPVNLCGSILYGYLDHGYPIVGDILIMQEGINDDGEPDIVGLPTGVLAFLAQMIGLSFQITLISGLTDEQEGVQSND
jgi:hypothetical protein